MALKTLHITNCYHATSGGVSTYYRALMRHANEYGRPMRLIVPGDSEQVQQFGDHCLIYSVPAKNTKVGDPRYRLMWPWGRTGKAIYKILRAEQADLIEISDKYSLPIIAGILRAGWIDGVRRPAVVGTSHERLHDNLAIYLKFGALGEWMSRTMLGKYYWLMFDHHVANSPYTAGELLPASQGHKVHRWLHVLPMGVDTDGLDPQKRSAAARLELSARAGISPDQKLVTYIGRLAPEKNLPLLLDMLEALPKQFHLIIAGDGELRPWLVEQAEQRTPGRLHLLGHLQNRASLAEVHAGADVCVHPNHREPVGMAP
ncbi:MAG: glycosyltransferase, partial [Bryobacteraceae bacterium]|nr:glycosyltransferase [Bryobacteraceae bacterium]